MSQKEMEFRIAPNGEMTIETFGMTGVSCASAITEVVATVGGVIAEDKKKVALEKTEALVTKEMKEEAKDTKLSKLPKMSDIEFAI